MITNYPFIFSFVSFFLLWFAAWLGWLFIKKHRILRGDIREDFGIILAATLTMLGLIIGFSFSMATTRYDLRKNYEEAEANAIGTEYVRADLLPADAAENVRKLLRDYLDQRILFYSIHESKAVREMNAKTTQLQTGLWAAVLAPAQAHPTPIVSLAVAGMNDVLNAQGYTQAAYWNRIPIAAWALMVTIAIVCNLLVGYGSHSVDEGCKLLPILPLMVSIAFMLIADIDSPHRGIIKVKPQNLISLAESLKPQ